MKAVSLPGKILEAPMAVKGLSTRTIKEVLRLKWEKKLSKKQIATSCNISCSIIRDYLERAQRAGLIWPLAPDLDDGRLEALLFPSAPQESPGKRGLRAMEYIRKELTRKGVHLRLLWLEYRRPIWTVISTASSASGTIGGATSSMSAFAKLIGPGKNSLSIMPARRSR
ncbi:MAG: hypothetical protein Q7U40_06110 [Desulfatirhabdiaceae bacterium]|nr:hypothetical protein [Desulfatirhabdiaceae bacterium]